MTDYCGEANLMTNFEHGQRNAIKNYFRIKAMNRVLYISFNTYWTTVNQNTLHISWEKDCTVMKFPCAVISSSACQHIWPIRGSPTALEFCWQWIIFPFSTFKCCQQVRRQEQKKHENQGKMTWNHQINNCSSNVTGNCRCKKQTWVSWVWLKLSPWIERVLLFGSIKQTSTK